ncbi:TPA: hypothetical protein N0F65_004020 [Lagenidium giganteum]|uniref:Uncharacterized protein n=1 Tax=Lagenidium giganteum TaxID=4803 RepID=A0AAV2YSV2_9STRA|nr:TPA: hypothetical protein N0F65_004020 [Lagenidium giganteum]
MKADRECGKLPSSGSKQDQYQYKQSSSAVSDAGRQDHVERRRELWRQELSLHMDSTAGYVGDDDPVWDWQVSFHAISTLPLGVQVAFRRKLLAIITLQLAVVLAIVSACVYVDGVETKFTDHVHPAIPFGATVVFLFVLYKLRNSHPWNWVFLILFTCAQGLFMASFSTSLFDNTGVNIGVMNVGFTVACVLLMTLMAGLQRGKKLVSPVVTALIAYAISLIVASGLMYWFHRRMVHSRLIEFACSMVLQLALILWFAKDVKAMLRVMSPDEYMRGVIYFYSDLVMLVLVVAAMIGVGAVCCCLHSQGGQHSTGVWYGYYWWWDPSFCCGSRTLASRNHDEDEQRAGADDAMEIAIQRD